jgi:beta-glucuronidase
VNIWNDQNSANSGRGKPPDENLSKVAVTSYEDGSCGLLVNDKPYMIRGMAYSSDPVGFTPQETNEWMHEDLNQNNRIDGPYDSWIDRNKDSFQDNNEVAVGDFQLLKEMGCNTIRLYHSDNINKELLRDLFQNYGIRVIMGNFAGAYTVSSGAEWSAGTDYTNAEQRARMKEEVLQMVIEHKDEPYILMWMLGNENDVPGSYDNSTFNNTNAAKKPQAYAEFINDVCKAIKAIDPNHPVGVCNATFRLMPYYNKYAPELDIIGMNAYTGAYGFSTLWNRIKTVCDRPVLITEYGTDCYNQNKSEVDEEYQAKYHYRAWQDIVNNSAWGDGAGNAIGGVIYCWIDKWWLCGSNKVHDVELGAHAGPRIDGMIHDEWLGVAGQGNGIRSPFLRQLRKVYYVYKDNLWNELLPDEEKE